MAEVWQPRLGAFPEGDGVRFRIWAPGHERLDLVLYGPAAEQLVPMQEEGEGEGYRTAWVGGIGAGARYRYRIDGDAVFPDPLSRSQPEGVHAPSEVVDPSVYTWGDDGWRGLPLEELVVYELHVGTFTPQGTFEAAVDRLEYLRSLGATAVQIMPVADFPGDRNWGYDGVFLFAPARIYGGTQGLKRFVDAAHRRGLAVLLDVVYNHFGPEGNYLPALTSGRIFTDAHHTPWGAAVNFDGPGSRAVRDLVIENTLHWIHEYRFDGLRLDATHEIIDDSEPHILQELTTRVHASVGDARQVVLIAEDERNDRRLITAVGEGGLGLDAVWADDFHHQVRRLAAGDDEGYFRNYSGHPTDVAETMRRGWFYEGQRYPSLDAPRGTPAEGISPTRFVHAIQNHDQIGNRAHGERLNHDVPLPVFRAASALLLLSPYTPLLFMGQEWAATSPFLYFTDHPEQLGRLVTAGRREEFKHFSAFANAERRAAIPDPQAEDTFVRSALHWPERNEQPHAGLLAFYRELLAMRRAHPALRERSRESFGVVASGDRSIALRRSAPAGETLLLFCAFQGQAEMRLDRLPDLHLPTGSRWDVRLWSEDPRYGGETVLPPILEDGVSLVLPSAGALLLELTPQ